MHFRMQRLDAAVEHFRKAGVVADLGDREPGVGQRLRGAAGGQERNAEARKPAREFDEARLVRDRKQSLRDGRGHASGEPAAAAPQCERSGADRQRMSYLVSLARSVLRFIPSMSAACV